MTGETGAAVPDWLGALIALAVTFALLGLREWLSWVGRVGDEPDAARPALSHRVWRRAGGTGATSAPAPPGSAATLPPQRDEHGPAARQPWAVERGREARPHE